MITSTRSENISMSVAEIARNPNDAGIPPVFGEENSRILIKMWRTLGQGGPVTQEMTAKADRELGIPYETVDEFLRPITERDPETISLVWWGYRPSLNSVGMPNNSPRMQV